MREVARNEDESLHTSERWCLTYRRFFRFTKYDRDKQAWLDCLLLLASKL